jgi:hypothetical protein
LRTHRPESHTEEGLCQIITVGQRRARAILNKRTTDATVRDEMRQLEEKAASKRMSAARKAQWEKNNAHIIAAYNSLKEESLTRLDREYLGLHEAIDGMKQRGKGAVKRKREEAEEAKAVNDKKKEDEKKARNERKAQEKKEASEKKARERQEREEKNAQIRAKAAGEMLDLKAAKIKKTKQTEEDLDRHRELEETALRVFRQMENLLPRAPLPRDSEVEDDEDNKENIG